MCLVALALDQHRRFPLVIASNRDEFFERPAARLAWWTAGIAGQPILSGRDIDSGGTWLGLTAAGRLALLTNIRDPQRHDPAAPSRGNIVPEWLEATETIDRFWMRTALSGHNGFNLIAADFRQGECFWASNVGVFPARLERGLYGLSNAGLDSPWPKVQALKGRMSRAIAASDSVDALAAQLFEALADRSIAPDETLPATGISLERERMLAPAFILTPDASYGTRCSTLVITERVNRNLVTHVFERSFAPDEGPSLMRTAVLRHWPPRHASKLVHHAEQGAVSESV